MLLDHIPINSALQSFLFNRKEKIPYKQI
jgi:hypothetical protein